MFEMGVTQASGQDQMALVANDKLFRFLSRKLH